MGYVIAAILVVLIVGAGIAFFVRNATSRKGRRRSPRRTRARRHAGRTDEHAPSGDDRTRERPRMTERIPTPVSAGPGEGGVGGEGEGSRPVPSRALPIARTRQHRLDAPERLVKASRGE